MEETSGEKGTRSPHCGPQVGREEALTRGLRVNQVEGRLPRHPPKIIVDVDVGKSKSELALKELVGDLLHKRSSGSESHSSKTDMTLDKIDKKNLN